VIIGLITVFMGYKAREVKLSYEMARMLPANDSTTIIYENFKQKFGEDGSVMFIGIQDKNLFSLNKFNDWYDLSIKLKNIQGVEEVLSVTRLFKLVKNDSLKKFEFLPVCSNRPKSQQEVDSIKKIIYSIPLYEDLIFTKIGGATLMMVTLDKNKLNTKNRVSLIREIKQTADTFGVKYNIPVHYSGLPYIRTVISKKVEDELKTICFTGNGCSRSVSLHLLPVAESSDLPYDHHRYKCRLGIGYDRVVWL